ncbi:TIGR01777 family oxidoreductase [Teredinibacter purpureus]|uniref:TIGR01777 family oxidoreductase n=1 Tax=Teredinibacter purpureus TaxID=2731756 RepID=UPI0005F7AAFA|nr:TIGR01777 family oxidoreductase [Teredinibacter purpureus]
MASIVVFINGGTGFIGRALCSALLKLSCQQLPSGLESKNTSLVDDDAHDYQLFVQTRMPSHHRHRSITFVSSYLELPEGVVPDVIVNLAGAPIAEKRWNTAQKKILMDSRVRLTESLLRSVKARGHVPKVLINASAVGYYGVRDNEILCENSAKGEGFAADLCGEWETAAQKFIALGSRVCIFRIGVVLGPGGGALSKLLPIFRLALGGPIAGGQQWLSWIHICDLVRMLVTSIHDPEYRGVVNATAPNPVRQAEFAKKLGAILCRPAFFPTPGFLLKIIYGQMAEELLIGGQHVVPGNAQTLGFDFLHRNIGTALEDVTQL